MAVHDQSRATAVTAAQCFRLGGQSSLVEVEELAERRAMDTTHPTRLSTRRATDQESYIYEQSVSAELMWITRKIGY